MLGWNIEIIMTINDSTRVYWLKIKRNFWINKRKNNFCDGGDTSIISLPIKVTSLAPSMIITAKPITKSPTNSRTVVSTIKPLPPLIFNLTKFLTKRHTYYPTKKKRTNYATRSKPKKHPTIVTTNPTILTIHTTIDTINPIIHTAIASNNPTNNSTAKRFEI